MSNTFINGLLLISFSAGPALAESFQDFLNTQRDQTKTEFSQFSKQDKDEFEEYKKQLQDAFKEYKKTVATVWGKKNSAIPSRNRDVSYEDNLKQRSIIDYKKGQVKVDIAVTPAEAKNPKLILKKMQDALKVTLDRGIDNRSIIDVAKNPSANKTTGKPVLSGLLQDQSGGVLKSADQPRFIRQQLKKLNVSKTRGTDKQPRVIVSTTIPMIPDHIRVSASRYKSTVDKYAGEMKLPNELVFAIMETESAFNPNARSSVPAFGLMQLVPTSGARDAYRLLYNKDKIVSDRYLYNPENNIKLGTAFIHKLYYIYLGDIKDPEARTWAAIAAYNTGAGNIFNAFVGKYRKSKFGNRSNWKKQALSLINKKTPEQVYQYLKRNLPHQETRNYIQNIRKRIPKYKSL